MVDSKSWNWEIVKDEKEKLWMTPSMESFYLLEKWASLGTNDFLDLGCGLGRHSILFAKNGYKTSAFDLSEYGVNRTKEWADKEGLTLDYKVGDMLNLPYDDASFDCILCMNVISHTDTQGMKKVIKELKRVLKDKGECYMTLGSKETWGFKQESWPLVDANTRIRKDGGEEDGLPHFYADYDLIMELFKDFKIESVTNVEDFYEDKKKGKVYSSFHYHVLIKKE